MTKTQNYQLPQWEADDPVRREDFNAANAALDAALAANAQMLADYQASNDTAVAKKADADAVAALAASLGSGGQNCRVAWGSYTGNGKAGSSNPNTLTFEFIPVAIVVTSSSPSVPATVMITGAAQALGNASTGGKCLLSWSGNSITWYNSSGDAVAQLNSSGSTYCYAAIGY